MLNASHLKEGGLGSQGKFFLSWLEAQANSSPQTSSSINVDGLEVKTQKPDFLRRIVVPTEKERPLLILLSGTSESGKSHAGKQLLNAGIASRVKLLRVVREVSGKQTDPNLELSAWSNSDKRATAVISRITQMLNKWDTPIAVVETIKHPAVLRNFRSDSRLRILSLFIDADLNFRVRNEATKISLPVDEVRTSILQKDEDKDALGNEITRSETDFLVLNNGSIENYSSFVAALGYFAKMHTRNYRGKPQLYD